MTECESFETPRLTAERPRTEDFDDLYRLHQDPRVMATLGGPRNAAETWLILENNLAHWARFGFGTWILRDREDRAFAGRAGLRHVEVGGRDEIELLYGLMPGFWGRGLATEIAVAGLDLGFGPLGLEDLVCFTLADNLASRRVMEKVGFVYERDVVFADLPHVLYRQSADEWRARGNA
jgi:RimJ/RimL family protein N-acetyltransferase